MQEITHEYVKKMFSYQNGHLFWTKEKKSVDHNSPAGYVDPEGYGQISLDFHRLKTHRLIWFWHYGQWPKEEIDHIDGDPHNNKIENLRDVTKQQNMRNRGSNKNNKLGIKNICWSEQRQSYVVQFDGTFRKRFKTLEEAIAVANEMRAKRHGEFARETITPRQKFLRSLTSKA
jgi:hypothetical protein